MGLRPAWVDSDDREEIRCALEAALPEAHRQALKVEASRLPRPDRWPDVAWIRGWVMRTAAFRMFERLQGAGCSKERARAQISSRLGVPTKTMERWEAELRAATWAV